MQNLPPDPGTTTKERPRMVLQHPWPIRATHWLNVLLVSAMSITGLVLLVGHRGPPDAHAGGTAPALHRHLLFAWPFLVNGLLYLSYVLAAGEWRRRFFWPPRDASASVRTVAWYLGLRRVAPVQAGLYNGLQRLTYSCVIVAAIVACATGLARWRPARLAGLLAVLGGPGPARALHLGVSAFLVIFSIAHIVMVLRQPGGLFPIITGGTLVDKE
jgi:thiosulfate reductase cytochrome b subunit